MKILMSIESRYCRCVMHVANQYPAYNPYAVCTSSIYSKQDIKRKGVVKCAAQYRFEDFDTEELRGYARMKKLDNAAAGLSRDNLIKALYRYVAGIKGKETWQEYVKEFRREHPGMSSSEATKLASKEYHREKKALGVE